MNSPPEKVQYRSSYSGLSNRPNPVEPHATTEKHPLNRPAKQLSKPNKKDFLGLLLHDDGATSSSRPSKRRKSGETNALDLPGLPVLEKHGVQRLRIPPTLSGLHQPPPDAGLLPSMSTEQPLDSVEKTESAKIVVSPRHLEGTDPANANKQESAKSSRKHKKWSESETADLLKGVARFGIGKWTLILNCPDFRFNSRTALDLKDRFRVCCPDEYRQGRSVKSSKQTEVNQSDAGEKSYKGHEPSRSKRSNRVSNVELEKLGIDSPFQKSKRRQRTEWDAKEDEALLAGFKVHNNSWAGIRNSTPVLKTRTTTDLRDRLRTRFPEEYAKAGLTPRPLSHARKGRIDSSDQMGVQGGSTVWEKALVPVSNKTNDKSPRKEDKQVKPALSKKQLPPTAVLHANDVFWGAPFEPEGSESEPITLDRGILDWPYDQRRAAINQDISNKGASIDPLATLNLPRPTAPSSANNTATATLSVHPNVLSTSSSNALPSVAALTAIADADTPSESLEPPSMVGAFGSLETDGRSSSHFMSMEELLS